MPSRQRPPGRLPGVRLWARRTGVGSGNVDGGNAGIDPAGRADRIPGSTAGPNGKYKSSSCARQRGQVHHRLPLGYLKGGQVCRQKGVQLLLG